MNAPEMQTDEQQNAYVERPESAKPIRHDSEPVLDRISYYVSLGPTLHPFDPD